MTVNASIFEKIGASFLTEIGFRADDYLKCYPDLNELGEARAAIHFLAFGAAEGRFAPFDASLKQANHALYKTNLSTSKKAMLARSLAFSRVRENAPLRQEHLPEFLNQQSSYRPLLIFGDSHIRFYTNRIILNDAELLPMPFTCFGASARGLNNEGSRADYGAKILKAVHDLSSYLDRSRSIILLHFGQVDIEFVFNIKRLAQGKNELIYDDLLRFCDDSIIKYTSYVKKIRAIAPMSVPVVVSSIFPPTLNDENLHEVSRFELVTWVDEQELVPLSAGIRDLQMPDWHMRTDAHRYFNHKLGDHLDVQGIYYLSAFDMFIGHDGLVDPVFLGPPNGRDHHVCEHELETVAVLSLIGGRLASIAETHSARWLGNI